MTAPDLNDLENIVTSLDGAVDCLSVVIHAMGYVKAGDPTCWLISKLRQDAEKLGERFEAAHKAHVAAKAGPRAVS
ncbi:MAG: hypothetical protein ACU0DI_08515, partial [Paracoccaceae bacterium]